MKSGEHFISEDDAVNIALKKFAGNVVAVELDEDDGRYVYEIEIISGGKEAEFEIDAKTGKWLDVKSMMNEKRSGRNMARIF